MDVRAEVDALVGFEGRAPGTDAERRAAQHLARRLRESGREADVESIEVRPGWPLTHMIHALLAIGGSLLAVAVPVVGLLVLFVAAVSTLGDLTGTFFLVRRMTPRRASQNVVSREDSDKGGILVLVAHYDAPRTGALFARRGLALRASLGKRIRRPIGPAGIFFWSIVVLFVCAGLRLLGIESLALTVVQFVPTVLLVLSVPLLADVQLGRAAPGANDNASGVAAALELADRFGGRLEHFDVWVLFTGAADGMGLGMREWLRAHRGELRLERTVFLNLDQVGAGTVRYSTREGLVFSYPFHPQLVEICRELAEGDSDDGFGAKPLASRLTSDAHVARTKGYAATTISCLGALDHYAHYRQPTDTPERIDGQSVERALGFASEAIERIDERIGPELGGDEAETALSDQ